MFLKMEIQFQYFFKMLFKGKEVYGASTLNDLCSLGFSDPTSNLDGIKIRDIQDYFRDKKGNPISLSMLGEHFTGENIQASHHSSIKDARMTAVCYRRMMKMKDAGMSRFHCEILEELRNAPKPIPKPSHLWDRKCCCGAKKHPKNRKKLGEFGFVNLDDFE
jgi:hypothetical protein